MIVQLTGCRGNSRETSLDSLTRPFLGRHPAQRLEGVATEAIGRPETAMAPRSEALSIDRQRAGAASPLQAALPDYIVLAQVQVIQLVAFERGRWSQALFHKMCQLSVDFVILRPDTSIVAAIELDTACGLFKIVAAMTAPCSVKATGRNFRCLPRRVFKITICDLRDSHSEAVSSKVGWEATTVAPHGLVERTGRHPIC